MINTDIYNYVNILDKAADASSFRNELISNNIANVNTPNYKRKDLNFENLLQAELGGEKNLGTAVRLYRRGAELGDELCAASLASLYQAGRGVKRDLAESCKWFALAALEADEGETRAAEALAALENSKELTPEVKLAARAEAEKLYKQIFGEEKLLPALKQ